MVGLRLIIMRLKKLSSYVNGDQKILDVLLHWCSAIEKEDKVETITKDITNRAIACAEQCSKDNHITIENAYPTPSNLQNYLSGHQSKNNFSANKEHVSELTRDDIRPKQSILALKTTWSSENTSVTLMLAIFALIIGLAILVSQRLRSNSASVDSSVESISIKQQAKTENRDSNVIVENITTTENDKGKISEVTTILNNSHQDGNIEFNEDDKARLINPTVDEVRNARLAENDEQQDVEEYSNASTAANPSATTDESEVDALHTIAMQQYAAKKLTTPSGDNALETYRVILFKYPNNEIAKQGIQNIHDRYVRWANHDLVNNKLDRAKYFFIKAIEVNTDDQKIQERVQSLATQLSAQVPQPYVENHVSESTTTNPEKN